MHVQPALKDLSLFRQAIPELGCSYYYKVFLMPKYFLFLFVLTAFPYVSQGGMDYSYCYYFLLAIFLYKIYFSY